MYYLRSFFLQERLPRAMGTALTTAVNKLTTHVASSTTFIIKSIDIHLLSKRRRCQHAGLIPLTWFNYTKQHEQMFVNVENGELNARMLFIVLSE